jgi:hypothetical protein
MEIVITIVVAIWAVGYVLALCLDDIWARAGWSPHSIALLPGGWANGPGPAPRSTSRATAPAPTTAPPHHA